MIFDQEFSIAHTFGIAAPDHLRVPGAAQPGPLTPPSRSDYRFRPALLSDLLAWHQIRLRQGPDAPPNRFYAYGVVARLAALAAAREAAQKATARSLRKTA